MLNAGKQSSRKSTVLVILSITSMIAFCGLWGFVVNSGLVQRSVLASPVDVVKTFYHKLYESAPDGATIGQHFRASLLLALIGYVFAAVIGVSLGLLMGWYKKFDRIVSPIFETIRPIPPIAWIPLSILWFGIGLPAKAFIIWLAAFVPAVINSYAGIKLTEPALINVARTWGATNREIFLKIGIPSALPMIFTGLKLSLGASWMTLVAAELLASTEGLGYMIQMGRYVGRPDIIIVGMLTIGFTGALMALGLDKLERRMAPWRRK